MNGKRKRGRDPEATRRRIVEAVVELHEEVGPARTTVSAVAERAGVQRLTVYRHFPDEAALIGACSAHWASLHPLPDAAEWAGLADPEARLEGALQSVYGYFRRGAPMLRQVLADEAAVPALGAVVAPYHAWFGELAGQLSAGWGVKGEAQRVLRAAIGHALRFETWASLAAKGLTDAQAVDLLSALVVHAAGRSVP
jgi:AcrR family transcriptional regulator